MEINEENKMLALIPATVCDTTAIYKETTPILTQILHTQNTKKTEEQERKDTKKSKEQEKSMLPSFLHIVTCYRTLIKTDHINTFIDYVKDKCNHMDSLGLNGSRILRNIKCKMPRFLEFAEQNNDFVHQNLDWFQQRLFDIYVTCNPYNHKTIEPPKVITKFRPLRPVVTREVEIEESGEDLSNPISNIVVMQGGIVTYSRHCMAICCVTRDGNRNDVRCSSSVTDFTRISEDTVLATLPFQKMILIINPLSFKIKRIQLGLILVLFGTFYAYRCRNVWSDHIRH
ncbi:Hypothetical predicted protein [Octopus vulgaris]|uniref:Uncharacterized protein n=1 Tax=Octopus vulgaris TaxID=6645 RepID=A0AA36BYI7_OCTVU|nr:Hypothetical predicted protein [Octopus vulgaris]